MSELKSYSVWDAPTRWFHWLNLLCIIGLAGFGLVILNTDALGISKLGKILLKTWHVWIGYVFIANLGIRFVWGFAGNHYARWRQVLPGGAGYGQQLRRYLSGFASGSGQQYLGHNPLGRLAVAALLLLMIGQAATGLVLAGTDLYFPPFGQLIARWIAAPGVDPGSLVPYTPETVDQATYSDMRAMRKPFAVIHLYGFYLLAIAVVIHVAGVVITETREGGSLISAMFTGRKILSRDPADARKVDFTASPGARSGRASQPPTDSNRHSHRVE